MSKKDFEKKVAALETLESAAELRKALDDRNNYYVSRAAGVVARRGLRELIPELVAAFDRFMADPVKSDPQCWAKNAIAKALQGFEYDDAAFFLRGIRHVQMEPVWGGVADTAAALRGVCAAALTGCSIARGEALRHLVDLLGADRDKTVRANAARAIAQLGGIESVLLLRLKALAGDPESEIVGQCFAGLLDLAPTEYIPFVAGFLETGGKAFGGAGGDIAIEAAAALGELPDASAIGALIENFRKSKDADVKRAVLLSLGASRLEQARDFLLATLGDGGVEEAVACVRALAASRFCDEVRDAVRKAVSRRQESKLSAAFEKEFES